MSLDLYIISKTPVPYKGTGVFVRENGRNRELSLKEAREMFPDWDIEETEYDFDSESNILWHDNITHNLTSMAKAVKVSPKYSLYSLLWRPEETGLLDKDNHPNSKYINLLSKGFDKLLHDPTLSVYNPENGWGDYNLLVKFTNSYLDALNSVSDYHNYSIEADR